MTRLRVVTWNVHGFVGRDGARDVDRTAEVLRDLDPDIVGLQEVDCRGRLPDGTDRLDRLAARTGLHATFGPTLHGPTGRYGNAFLTRWPATVVSYRDVSVAGWEPRGILTVDVHVDGRRLRLIVTHFGVRAVERRAQIGQLLDLINEEPQVPVVLMGDFNEWHPRAPVAGKLDAVLGEAERPRSFPARFPLLALDRIWVRPRELVVELSAHRHRRARRASDHLPLVALLDLDPNRR